MVVLFVSSPSNLVQILFFHIFLLALVNIFFGFVSLWSHCIIQGTQQSGNYLDVCLDSDGFVRSNKVSMLFSR